MNNLLRLPFPQHELVGWTTCAHLPGHVDEPGLRRPLLRQVFLAQVNALMQQLAAAELGCSASSNEHDGAFHDAVVLAAEDPLDVARGLLAAWARRVRAIIPANLRPSTLQEVAQTAQASFPGSRALIWTAEQLKQAELALALSSSESAPDALGGEFVRNDLVAPDTVLLSAYTSGTTGAPERHDKSARQLLGEAQMQAATFLQNKELSAVICSIPAHHLYGLLFGVLAPLYAALPISAAASGPRPSLQELSRDMQRPALVTVPAHLHSLLRTAPEVLERFDCVFSSSAPLPAEVGQAVRALRRPISLVEVWGSTETGGAGFRMNDPGGPWQPLPGVTISTNEDEQLVLLSPYCPRASGSPYVCQDKVELLAQGFRHLGRADGVVKVGGKRISLQDLEATALRCSAIAEAACLTEEARGLRGVQILMVLSPSIPRLPDAELLAQLQTTLRERFDDVVLPRRFRIIDQLPRTTTGKLNRQALLALFSSPSTHGPSA